MELKNVVEKQKEFFNTDETKSVGYRISMLRKLENVIKENEKQILSALYEDLSKSEAEAYMTEIGIVYGEIREALKNVKKWSKPRRVRGSLGTFPAKSYVYSEPYGVVLIISPWNYPFNLSFSPLVAAIAAGNCAVIKCSKESKNTSKIIRDIINKTFEEEYIYCVDSELDYDEILHQRYDFIFFTGSARVGKIIMSVASENLIPVSLELGGKSPCIIDETADIKLSAKRIVWGKLLNAGQTCVSIDYIVEMMPKTELLNDVIVQKDGKSLNVESMLNVINQRIEFLFDREHTIGHAFFMKLKKEENPSIETLASIFQKSVIPLLQEYFYEDYQKIQLVLGDNGKSDQTHKFILDEEVKVKSIFKGNADEVMDLPEKNYTVNPKAFMNIDAYKEIF